MREMIKNLFSVKFMNSIQQELSVEVRVVRVVSSDLVLRLSDSDPISVAQFEYRHISMASMVTWYNLENKIK